MSEKSWHKVGAFVYIYRKPRKVGKVVSVEKRMVHLSRGAPVPTWDCRVRWVDGTETVEDHLCLSDFNELIESHRKKLATHEKMLKRVAAL
jgi:hypothetical protein